MFGASGANVRESNDNVSQWGNKNDCIKEILTEM